MNSSRILTLLFAIATLMGTGPGLYLVGSPTEEGLAQSLLGVPALYAWVAFWFLVQAGIIMMASHRFWVHRDEPAQ